MKYECTHGIKWTQKCLHCEEVGLLDTIANFEPLVLKAKRELEEVRKQLNKSKEG